MELTRQYKNAAGDDIRIDVIQMRRKGNTIASAANTHTFIRDLKVRPIYNTSVSDRVVAEIEVIGDFTTMDGSGFAWASWESPAAKADMSDLPAVGDTV